MGEFVGRDRSTIDERWEQLVRRSEERMRRDWIVRQFVPLKDNVRGFEVTRLRTMDRVVELTDEYGGVRGTAEKCEGVPKYGHEVPVESHHGFVRGRIDAIVPSEAGPILRDYKSGYILERESEEDEIRHDYVVQLQVYAALYYRSVGEWPVRLELAPLTGSPVEVEFRQVECERALEDGVKSVREINTLISELRHEPRELERRLAQPKAGTCRFCRYRPACVPYRETVNRSESREEWPCDSWGVVSEVRTLGDGRILLSFESGDQVRSLNASPERHPALARLGVGDGAGVFGAKRTKSQSSCREGPYTTIYQESADGPS